MDATIKHITINKKLAFVLSIINNEITSHIKSLDILMVRNLIPAFSFPYRYFLNTKKTTVFKIISKKMTIKLSKKFILQK